LLAAGRSDREIAAALFISHRTVSRHLQNIYAKLEVNSRTAASAFAHRHGLA
jgi:DNA-binding NarL/FixJ family response regulator